MESQLVQRRMNVIAAHLASPQHVSSAAPLSPLGCSSYPDSVIRRADSITFFARQGSASQGYFMRQASTTQQGTWTQVGMHSKSISCEEMQPCASDAPAFARPAQVNLSSPTIHSAKSVVDGCGYDNGPEPPMFAKPRAECEQPHFQYKETTINLTSKEVEWSPKMDVVESGFNYVVAFEIPGVGIENLKVEVNNESLIVTGKRSTWSCGGANSNCSDSYYHRREILQGPYRVVWQLPTNANKESVSAEIHDGFLRVTIPKLSALRWLSKSHM